jgi:hypothetical protein
VYEVGEGLNPVVDPVTKLCYDDEACLIANKSCVTCFYPPASSRTNHKCERCFSGSQGISQITNNWAAKLSADSRPSLSLSRPGGANGVYQGAPFLGGSIRDSHDKGLEILLERIRRQYIQDPRPGHAHDSEGPADAGASPLKIVVVDDDA